MVLGVFLNDTNANAIARKEEGKVEAGETGTNLQVEVRVEAVIAACMLQ
jgi:hypothetical protein